MRERLIAGLNYCNFYLETDSFELHHLIQSMPQLKLASHILSASEREILHKKVPMQDKIIKLNKSILWQN